MPPVFDNLREGILGSPMAEEDGDLLLEVGELQTAIDGIFLLPTSAADFGAARVQRPNPQVDVDHAAFTALGAVAGSSVIRQGTRYTIVDIPPPNRAGLSRVTLREYLP